MKTPMNTLGLCAASLLFFTAPAWSQMVAEYKFVQGSPNATRAAEFLEASPCEPRLGAEISANAQNAHISATAGVLEIGDRAASAQDVENVPSLDFTLAPAKGHQLTLDSIDLKMGGSAGPTVSPYTFKLIVLSSLDQFQSVIAESAAMQIQPGTNVHATESFEVLLPADFDGLTQPVTFRISVVMVENTKAALTQRVRVDNVTFSGDVAPK